MGEGATGKTIQIMTRPPKTGSNSSSVCDITILTTAVCYIDLSRKSQRQRGHGFKNGRIIKSIHELSKWPLQRVQCSQWHIQHRHSRGSTLDTGGSRWEMGLRGFQSTQRQLLSLRQEKTCLGQTRAGLTHRWVGAKKTPAGQNVCYLFQAVHQHITTIHKNQHS